MFARKPLVVLALLSVVSVHAFGLRKQDDGLPRLLLISFDGFRANYLQEHDLPTFNRFMQSGVFAKTKPSFTTLTFPNHYSMVTGLTEEHHGIVGNSMYDKFMNQSFSLSCCNYNSSWWQQNPNVMPIWMANQAEGNNRRSGAVGFVGSLSPICGNKIFKVVEYSDDRPFTEIVDTMITWFTDPAEPVNFVSIYFYEPDKTGHNSGPVSADICRTLLQMDELLASIEQKMTSKGIWDDTNVVITTDHGMTAVDPVDRAVVLERYIDLSRCIVKNSLSIANIYAPDLETAIAIHGNLSNIPHYNTYFRETVPAEYKYNKNIRIGDVVMVPDPGYLIFNTESYRNSSTIRGTHGYNNSDPEMLGILMAKGPAIVENMTNPELIVDLVDVYPLMTEILRLPRREVDGNYDVVQPFLKR